MVGMELGGKEGPGWVARGVKKGERVEGWDGGRKEAAGEAARKEY